MDEVLDASSLQILHAGRSTSYNKHGAAVQILEGRDVPLTYTKDLKEMSWGNFEGARDEEYPEE